MRSAQRICVALMVLMLLVGSAVAQSMPQVENAKVSQRAGSLEQAIAATNEPGWVGYAVQVVRPIDWDWDNNRVVYLEGNHVQPKPYVRAPGTPAPWGNVLLRVAGGRVERVTLQAPERVVDAGGLPLVWVNGVSSAESIRVLRGLVEAQLKVEATGEKLKGQSQPERGLSVLAQHDDPAATGVLRGFTAASYPEHLRQQAAFWLAEARGREGLNAVAALLKSEPVANDALREQLVFDFTVVKEAEKPAALDLLLAEAKSDASTKVRSKAQFWLAQAAGKKMMTDTATAMGIDPRVAETLGDQANHDSDASIRKSAVFAISRLPDEQGVPKLIELAKTSPDPGTRREAIFWLGQKKDARALAYLESVVRQ